MTLLYEMAHMLERVQLNSISDKHTVEINLQNLSILLKLNKMLLLDLKVDRLTLTRYTCMDNKGLFPGTANGGGNVIVSRVNSENL